jgi:hypothetical protein
MPEIPAGSVIGEACKQPGAEDDEEGGQAEPPKGSPRKEARGGDAAV